ncbi:hypothetical protein [Streptomyces lavendulocolor]|uniref:hypothetical protein n=1 Tax=Streptomyces lavendulocolor TaxID=67316 RepID=UPI0033D98385
MAGLVLTAAPASAAVIDCPGYINQQFSPGLALTPQHVSFNAEGPFGPCVGTDSSHVFAELKSEGDGTLSCLVSSPVKVNGTIRWSDAQKQGQGTSHFVGTVGVAQRPLGVNVIVTVAAITSGEFAGQTLTLEVVITSTDLLACGTSQGLRQVAGPANFTLV